MDTSHIHVITKYVNIDNCMYCLHLLYPNRLSKSEKLHNSRRLIAKFKIQFRLNKINPMETYGSIVDLLEQCNLSKTAKALRDDLGTSASLSVFNFGIEQDIAHFKGDPRLAKDLLSKLTLRHSSKI